MRTGTSCVCVCALQDFLVSTDPRNAFLSRWSAALAPFDAMQQRLPLRMLLMAPATPAAATAADGGSGSSSVGGGSGPCAPAAAATAAGADTTSCRLFPEELHYVFKIEKVGLSDALQRTLRRAGAPYDLDGYMEAAPLLDVLRFSNVDQVAAKDSTYSDRQPQWQVQQQVQQAGEFVLLLMRESDTHKWKSKQRRREEDKAKDQLARYRALLERVRLCWES